MNNFQTYEIELKQKKWMTANLNKKQFPQTRCLTEKKQYASKYPAACAVLHSSSIKYKIFV